MAGVQETLDRALALGDEGRWEEMAKLLAGALQESPDDAYLLCWLGVAEQELGNEGAAYEYFRRCLEQQPEDPHLLALAGSGLAAFDDPEAEAALRTAALTGPDLPMARLQYGAYLARACEYGAYLARAGVFDDAFLHLKAARDLAPEDPTVHAELGVAYALKGDLDEAASAMERALDLAPDDSWTRVLLGLVDLELGLTEEAAEALIMAAEEREDDAEAHMLAALAAAAVGWDDAAHTALTRAEYAATGSEIDLVSEIEERIMAGRREARAMLMESLAPSILRERLRQPL